MAVLPLDISHSKTFTKDFYIPQQWQGSGATMQMLVTKRREAVSVVLVSIDELAVFHNGLNFEEHMAMPTKAKSSTAPSNLLERPALMKRIPSLL